MHTPQFFSIFAGRMELCYIIWLKFSFGIGQDTERLLEVSFPLLKRAYQKWQTQDGTTDPQHLRQSMLWCCSSKKKRHNERKGRSGNKLIRDVKRAIFLYVVLAVSSLRLSLAVFLFFSVSVVTPVLCHLNHSSGSLWGRLPHLFPLTLLFFLLFPLLGSRLVS